MSILLENLVFSYDGKNTVLNIPHWAVAAGEKVFLLGASGSGKTTLLNILAGLTPVKQGAISLCEQPLQALSAKKLDRFRACLLYTSDAADD